MQAQASKLDDSLARVQRLERLSDRSNGHQESSSPAPPMPSSSALSHAPLMHRNSSSYAGQLGGGSFRPSGATFGGPAVGMSVPRFLNHNPLGGGVGKGSRKGSGAFPAVADVRETGRKVHLGAQRLVSLPFTPS